MRLWKKIFLTGDQVPYTTKTLWKAIIWRSQLETKVVITWSRLAGMKFCPVLPRSWQCYKLFINYILRLHVKSGIPPWPDLPRSRFAGTKFSHVIASAHLSGMKQWVNICLQRKIKGKCVENCFAMISPCNRRVKLKFRGKPRSCNHLRSTWKLKKILKQGKAML